MPRLRPTKNPTTSMAIATRSNQLELKSKVVGFINQPRAPNSLNRLMLPAAHCQPQNDGVGCASSALRTKVINCMSGFRALSCDGSTPNTWRMNEVQPCQLLGQFPPAT